MEPGQSGSPEQLLTVDEVAAWLQVTRSTLYGWRYQGRGPQPLKLGKFLRYRRGDVEEYIASAEVRA